eukprot:4505132-Lingulodinium_polyedra.AAC.1
MVCARVLLRALARACLVVCVSVVCGVCGRTQDHAQQRAHPRHIIALQHSRHTPRTTPQHTTTPHHATSHSTRSTRANRYTKGTLPRPAPPRPTFVGRFRPYGRG